MRGSSTRQLILLIKNELVTILFVVVNGVQSADSFLFVNCDEGINEIAMIFFQLILCVNTFITVRRLFNAAIKYFI